MKCRALHESVHGTCEVQHVCSFTLTLFRRGRESQERTESLRAWDHICGNPEIYCVMILVLINIIDVNKLYRAAYCQMSAGGVAIHLYLLNKCV